MEALERPPWNPARRCTALNRNRTQCGRQPIPGGFVCAVHGAGAPQVQLSAKKRLLEGADLAIDYLLNLLEQRPPCETCGRSDNDRDPVVVKACQLVLDRSGFHPALAIEHIEQPNEFEDASIDELISTLETMLADTRAQRDAQQQHQLTSGFVDGEVFEFPEECVEIPDSRQTALASSPQSAESLEFDDADARLRNSWQMDPHSAPIQEDAVPFPLGNDTPDDGRDDK